MKIGDSRRITGSRQPLVKLGSILDEDLLATTVFTWFRERLEKTSVRFSATTECTNWNDNETKCTGCYLGQFAVDANLDGVTHYGVYLNNLVFE